MMLMDPAVPNCPERYTWLCSWVLVEQRVDLSLVNSVADNLPDIRSNSDGHKLA